MRFQLLDRWPLKKGTWKSAVPAARLLRGWNGWAASLSRTTRDTPNAAAERITAPTFSGSWNGMNRVQPSGHSAVVGPRRQGRCAGQQQGGVRPRDVESLKERSGEPIPGQGGGGRGRSTGVRDPGQGPVGKPSQDLRDDPRTGEEGLAVLANAPSRRAGRGRAGNSGSIRWRPRAPGRRSSGPPPPAGAAPAPRFPAARRRPAGAGGSFPGSRRQNRRPAGRAPRVPSRPGQSRRRTPVLS